MAKIARRVTRLPVRITRTANIWVVLWLGLLALAASALEQHRLGLTTLSAAGVSAQAAFSVPKGYHLMPDGTLMAGTMHGAAPTCPPEADDGHPQPSSDTDACIALASMAAFTLAVPVHVGTPIGSRQPAAQPANAAVLRAHAHPAYASRGPPTLI